MGRGIATNNETRRCVRFDYCDLDEDDDHIRQYEWKDAIAAIRHALPPSFDDKVDKWIGRDRHVIAESSWYYVLVEEDDCNGIGVEIEVRDYQHDFEPDAEYDRRQNFAKANLRRIAEAFFDRLGKIYDLRVPTSNWTSAPRGKTA